MNAETREPLKRRELFAFQTSLILMTFLCLSSQAHACPVAQEVGTELSNKTEAVCGKRIVWDLAKFVPDDEICGSRRQGLNLIQRVLEDVCESRVPGDDLTEKLERIEVVAHLKPEFRYELKARVLKATVPIKEAPVLSKWNESRDQLLDFLRKSTGLKLESKAKREEISAAARVTKQPEREQAAKEREAKREAIYRERDRRIAKMRSEMEAATAKYVARTKEISARQTSGMSSGEIDRQKRDLEEALKELQSAQTKFQADVQNLTKEMDEALKAP